MKNLDNLSPAVPETALPQPEPAVPDTDDGYSDEALLCDSCDVIDNTVYGAIVDVATGISKNGSIQAAIASADVIDEAIKTVCAYPDDYDALKKSAKLKVRVEFANAVEIAFAENAPDISIAMAEHRLRADDIEWDMSIIGEVTDALEQTLNANGVIRTCHPWQNENEHICYSLDCERCSYCPRKK